MNKQLDFIVLITELKKSLTVAVWELPLQILPRESRAGDKSRCVENHGNFTSQQPRAIKGK